ncbi:MAG: aminotransferase class V-fold PLP-dependent enzyme [Kofleriaceae bacterium]
MSDRPRQELELSSDDFTKLILEALPLLAEHLDGLSARPASRPLPEGQVLAGLAEGLPTEPTSYAQLLKTLFHELLPWGYETAGPGYLAFMPSGGILHAAVADLLTAAINRYVGVWAASPGLAELEAQVLRWFGEMLGMPSSTRGFLASGGSIANFSAVIAARHHLLGEELAGGTAYGSDIAHHSMLKAMMLAGFPQRAVRELPSDERYRLCPERVRKQVREDRAAGLRPFLLIASAGTTLTGTIDPLEELAEVAREERLWLHVDAAYGGFFALTQRGRHLLRGIEAADSVTLDPHKSLFLPYGTGALLVRHGEVLRAAHQTHGQRYSPRQGASERIDFCEHSPELSREARGLRVWLPLRMHGVTPFRDCLDEKLELTQWLVARLAELPELELVLDPPLTVVVLRWRPAWCASDGDALDALNRELLAAVNAKGRVLLIGVTLRGRFVLRICVLSFRTHQAELAHAVEDLRAALAELRAKREAAC